MTYPNLHTAVRALSRKLHTFAGHGIDACHTSYCFDQMARAIDYINREPSAKSVNFDGEIYIEGKAHPVLISFTATDMSKQLDVSIQMA